METNYPLHCAHGTLKVPKIAEDSGEIEETRRVF
jgi:hypothetical protein